MGTKNNPGIFDCYANAHPDEPMFILLGRDRMAPALVRAWAKMRADEGEDATKVKEAMDCADAMERFGRMRRRSAESNKEIDELEALIESPHHG